MDEKRKPKTSFGSVLKAIGSPEGMASTVLPLAAIVETMATQGRSPGTVSAGQQSRMFDTIARRDAQAEKESKLNEERLRAKEEAVQRAQRKQLEDQYAKETEPERRKQLMYQLEPESMRKMDIQKMYASPTAASTPKKVINLTSKSFEGLGLDETMSEIDRLSKQFPQYEFRFGESRSDPTADALKTLSLAMAQEKLGREKKGKILSGADVDRVAGFRGAVAQMTSLAENLADPESPTGPVAFLRKLNPFDVEAQGTQQLIAATKQVVGKALEGGVLRKEDESKYAKILPQLQDPYNVALRKVENIMSMLNTDYRSKRQSFQDVGYDVTGLPETISPDLQKILAPFTAKRQEAEAAKGTPAPPQAPAQSLPYQTGDLVDTPNGRMRFIGSPEQWQDQTQWEKVQ